MSGFERIEAVSPIQIPNFAEQYNNCTAKFKANLLVGAYKNADGEPWVLPVVRKVEKILAKCDTLDKENTSILGIPSFTDAATQFLLGADSVALREKRAGGVQAVSGTGALRLAAETLSRVFKYSIVYASDSTWESHELVFRNGGFKEYRTYRYWKATSKSFWIEGMLEDLRKAPEYSAIIIQACAHNSTGLDPSKAQWAEIASVMREGKLFPIFDSAYLGFATGNAEQDAWAIRYFVEQGFDLMCCQSFAKDFGLYNERIGNLVVVCKNSITLNNLLSRIKLVELHLYLMPPMHGARIVSMILSDATLKQEWMDSVKVMYTRLCAVRLKLYKKLVDLDIVRDWSHLVQQRGMLFYTGFNERQVDYLRETHNIYLRKDGRASLCDVNEGNLEFIANALIATAANA